MNTFINEDLGKGLSDKYKKISTLNYLQPFLNKGWKVFKSQSKGKKEIITLTHENFKTFTGDDITLMVQNSYDGKSSFQVIAGVNVKACTNGCVWGDEVFETFRVIHKGNMIKETLENSYEKLVAGLNVVKKVSSKMRNTELNSDKTDEVITRIAKKIIEKDTPKQKIEVLNITPLVLRFLKRPVKSEVGSMVWHRFQAVQERITRYGDLRVLVKITNKETNEVIHRSKRVNKTELNSPIRNKELNRIISSEFLKEVA